MGSSGDGNKKRKKSEGGEQQEAEGKIKDKRKPRVVGLYKT